MKKTALVALALLTAGALAGCSAPEPLSDDFACVHFAALTEKLYAYYLDPLPEAATEWNEARESMSDTIDMANGEILDLVTQARDALPDTPVDDPTEFDAITAELAPICEPHLTEDGYDIRQLGSKQP